MILELIAGGLVAADFIYHRYIEDHPKDFSNFADSINIPQTEEGTPIPYIYGKVRITRPLLWWMSVPEAIAVSGGAFTGVEYAASLFFVLGAPFAGGDSENRIHRLWQGDTPYVNDGETGPGISQVELAELDGNGGFEDDDRGLALVAFQTKTSDGTTTSYSAGAVEFLNGRAAQVMTDEAAPYDTHTRASAQMVDSGIAPEDVVGYRGKMSMLLYGLTGIHSTTGFIWGLTPQLGAISVEASSYKTDGGYPAVGSMGRVGPDSNPINVLYDLLVDKLGVPANLIDDASFGDAAITVYQESNGFSRCFDARMPARDMIREILRQVDGGIFEDPSTGKIKIKLARSDFDYATLPHITRRNCRAIQNLAISGLTDMPNRVLVKYRDRDQGYIEATASDQNPANAVGQDGIEQVVELAFPGITNAANASRTATRELAALSRSIIKCRALIFREFLDLGPLDAVRVTWSKPDIGGLVFRVAGPPYQGTLRDGAIAVDLISDFSYQYRALPPQPSLPHPDIGTGIVVGLGMR